MSEQYKKGPLRTVIRNAKEGLLIYRPDLGLVTRTAYYADNSQLKGLIESELLKATEMAHGLGEDTSVDDAFRLIFELEDEHDVLATQFIYESDGEVEYKVFSSSVGTILINKRMMKPLNGFNQLRYSTNEKRDRLILKDEKGIIVSVLMAFIPKDEERDKIDSMEW